MRILSLFLLLTGSCVVHAQSITDFFDYPEYNQFVVLADSAGGIVKPTDLDFHPAPEQQHECWVTLKGQEDHPGMMFDLELASRIRILHQADTDQPVVYGSITGDPHFMLEPMAIAFGDNTYFATTGGSYQQYIYGDEVIGLGQGPVLWPSEEALYGYDFSFNPLGLSAHIDMLHQNTYSMGIAHDRDNAYWVFDGYNGRLIHYDFKTPHPPGEDDHSDGRTLHFPEMSLNRVDDLPSHLAVDQSTGWLYIADSGNGRIIRFDTQFSDTTMQLVNDGPDGLAHDVFNVEWSVVTDQNLELPSGIEVVDEHLLVSDHGTSELILYQILPDGLMEVGRLELPAEGVMGIRFAHQSIYYVDYLGNELVKINNDRPTALQEWQDVSYELFPNPVSDQITLRLNDTQGITQLQIFNALGQMVLQRPVQALELQINSTNWATGVYHAQFYRGTLPLAPIRFVKE